jgi:hypothetical protein
VRYCHFCFDAGAQATHWARRLHLDVQWLNANGCWSAGEAMAAAPDAGAPWDEYIEDYLWEMGQVVHDEAASTPLQVSEQRHLSKHVNSDHSSFPQGFESQSACWHMCMSSLNTSPQTSNVVRS